MSLRLRKRLIEKLTETHDFHPISYFAKELNVSKRTIHSYINEMEKRIEYFDCEIKRTPGKGIVLIGSPKQKEALLKHFEKERYPIDLSPVERRQAILYRFLQGESNSYSDLSEDYYVSRSTIVSDIKWIKECYLSEETDFHSNREGTYLKISERAIQNIWGKLIADQFEEEKGYVPVKLTEYAMFFSERYPGSKDMIIEIEKHASHLAQTFQLADYYMVSLFENLLLLSMRIDAGFHHEKEEGYLFERVGNLDTYVIAGEIAERLSTQLDLEFAPEDIVYLNECFIANGLREADTSEYSIRYEEIVDRLIQKFSTVLDLDLSKDKKLRKGLLNHLIPMYFRIQQEISLPNPYIQEIKRQYSMMFHLTWFLLVDLEQELNKRIPEDEIGFMMVHFQSALERNRDIKKIIIVSQTGVLTSELLEMRVKKALPSIHVYETISENELERVDLTKVDVVLSTIQLEVEGVDMLEISSIPTDEELQVVSRYITQQFSEKNSFQLGHAYAQKEHSLKQYISRQHIYKEESWQSSEEIIKGLVEPLIKLEYVSEEYLGSVLGREQLSSTAFETGVAIPHGNPEFVRETSISVYVSDQKISWGEEKVDVVILFSIAKEDISELRTIIEPIYEVMYSREQVERIFKEHSVEGIYHYLSHL